MFWQIIAVLCVGLGASGIVSGARVFCKKIPRWTAPAFAGLAMIGFQIYGEYTWYAHQQSILPEGVEVLGTIEEPALLRPWSMVVPQTTRFLAADNRSLVVNNVNSSLVRIRLYSFERGKPAQTLFAVIDCADVPSAETEQQVMDNVVVDSYSLGS